MITQNTLFLAALAISAAIQIFKKLSEVLGWKVRGVTALLISVGTSVVTVLAAQNPKEYSEFLAMLASMILAVEGAFRHGKRVYELGRALLWFFVKSR